MLQAITDGVRNDRIGDDLGPVIEWQLGGEHDGLTEGALLEDLAQIRASVAVSLRMPTSSSTSTSGLASLSRYRRYVPLERARAKFSSQVVTFM
jgi:hypothetical protein